MAREQKKKKKKKTETKEPYLSLAWTFLLIFSLKRSATEWAAAAAAHLSSGSQVSSVAGEFRARPYLFSRQ